MCKGLPASGKSTWAKAQVLASNGQTKRVNLDDLRAMVDAGEWSKSNEKIVQALQTTIVEEFLRLKKNVIIDNTNFHPKHETLYREVAKQWKATFAIQDFTDVSVEECVRRDLLRPVSVGEKVIRKMARDYLTPQTVSVDPPDHIDGVPTAVIFDIDGTLAKMNGRGPHDYDRVSEDLPNSPVIHLLREWVRANIHNGWHAKLIICSGRPDTEQCRKDTEAWLKRYVFEGLGLLTNEWVLFMRPEWMTDPKSGKQVRDFRQDVIIKREIYEREIKGKYNVQVVYDDRDQVVAGWRALGLLCCQVAPGDF